MNGNRFDPVFSSDRLIRLGYHSDNIVFPIQQRLEHCTRKIRRPEKYDSWFF
jgi:hypothetical protein